MGLGFKDIDKLADPFTNLAGRIEQLKIAISDAEIAGKRDLFEKGLLVVKHFK